MTVEKIAELQADEAAKLAAKYEAARKIREALDQAREVWGDQYEADDVESAILELAQGDD